MPAKRPIQSYSHDTHARANNPPVGLVDANTDPEQDAAQTYAYDPHLDPQLQWAGKTEHTSFTVPTQSLHVHERIDPRTIIEVVRKRNSANGAAQTSLFAEDRAVPTRQAIQFYQHKHNWSNRLITGDSLLVMNSLLQKETMAGKVQCAYIDPPYGIKYGSNFQPFVDQREVKDGQDSDLTTEPEMIKAFRDTWELGIHSYLTYMRDRLLLARELLSESGSCFVQIGDENVHRMAAVMDDIFGAENRVTTITFATTSGSVAKTIPEVSDYLLWYAKDKDKTKYQQLYEPLTRAEVIEYFSSYSMVELSDGNCRKLTREERFDPDKFLPKDARIYQRVGLDSQGVSTTGRSESYTWNGRKFRCSVNRSWSISTAGMDRLGALGRLEALEKQSSLRWKKYEEEVPGRRINNMWAAQMYPSEKRYVVETSTKAIQRCMLMTTDPGDLVLDITCGSGTTAYVAEQWGRRWITCDTSRVATTLAKQRLMTATFDYYPLAKENEGLDGGFIYKTVPNVSPAILAYDQPATQILLYDQPTIDRKQARVTGPFTVEAVPAATVIPIDAVRNPDPAPADNTVARSGETVRHTEWCEALKKAGIRGKQGQHISFANIEPLPHRHLHANAETTPNKAGSNSIAELPETALTSQRAVISFGPEHAPLETRQVEHAWQEAKKLDPKPAIIIFAAFQFDPEAAKDIDELDPQTIGMQLLKVQMNADLQTADLKKQDPKNESFWLVGQPDIELAPIPDSEPANQYQVTVRGFDYFNTKTGDLESGNHDRIAVWMLDTDYDGRCLYPSQVFFPMSGHKSGWSKLAKNLKAEIDPERITQYVGTLSLPFNPGKHNRIAVKIVDDRGIESLKVMEIGDVN